MDQPTTQIQGNLRALSNKQADLKPILKYCLYSRKSMEQSERQALSIDSQIKEMLKVAERDNLEVTEIRRESHSAKASGARPIFKQLLVDIEKGLFNGILTWAPDRLSRNAGDLGELVDLMDHQKLVEIRTFSQIFTNSPNEKFLLMILGSQAKLENDNRGVNVKRGLRARVEMGLWPGQAPTGYLTNKNVDKKGQVLVDPDRAPVLRKMFEKVAYENVSGRKLYAWLKFDIDFKTKYGKHLTLSNVYRILNSPFYYGRFQYPKESGNWYQGKHEPLISQELYELVQQAITRGQHIKSEAKEFMFVKLIKCGACGSGITADEKFKKLLDGSVSRYVYYGCTKGKDIHCRTGYIREDELLKQMLELIDRVDLNQLGIKEKIENEIDRYYKFKTSVLGESDTKKNKRKDLDIKNYAKYILREGSVYEKRDLLANLRSKLVLKDKKLGIETA
jgi:DNA invertase Pin-like site-specific DNA recombinase